MFHFYILLFKAIFVIICVRFHFINTMCVFEQISLSCTIVKETWIAFKDNRNQINKNSEIVQENVYHGTCWNVEVGATIKCEFTKWKL